MQTSRETFARCFLLLQIQCFERVQINYNYKKNLFSFAQYYKIINKYAGYTNIRRNVAFRFATDIFTIKKREVNPTGHLIILKYT